MIFSSVTFIFYFMPIFIIIYFVTPSIFWKNVVTVVFSFDFYAWGDPYIILILIASIAFNMLAAMQIDARTGSARRTALAISIAVNLIILAVFRYLNFYSQSEFYAHAVEYPFTKFWHSFANRALIFYVPLSILRHRRLSGALSCK